MKSKVVAALLSGLVLPGAGQWYLGRRRRALAFLAPAAVAGLAYVSHVIDDARAVTDQVLGGSVPMDTAAISAQLAARPMSGWIYAAGVVFVVCYVGSIVEALLGRVDGTPPVR
jgi:hypothetical protein